MPSASSENEHGPLLFVSVFPVVTLLHYAGLTRVASSRPRASCLYYRHPLSGKRAIDLDRSGESDSHREEPCFSRERESGADFTELDGEKRENDVPRTPTPETRRARTTDFGAEFTENTADEPDEPQHAAS